MDLEKENKELKHCINYSQSVVSKLQQQVKKLTRDLVAYEISTPLCPVEFTMTNFEQHKKDCDRWYSPPFFTHPNGYKMCLLVYAGGCGDGANTHVSLFLTLMMEENDEQLQCPFQGKFIIKLLSQVGDRRHSKKINFLNKPETNRNGWGRQRFILHTELEPMYLRNDCLKFCVKKVD